MGTPLWFVATDISVSLYYVSLGSTRLYREEFRDSRDPPVSFLFHVCCERPSSFARSRFRAGVGEADYFRNCWIRWVWCVSQSCLCTGILGLSDWDGRLEEQVVAEGHRHQKTPEISEHRATNGGSERLSLKRDVQEKILNWRLFGCAASKTRGRPPGFANLELADILLRKSNKRSKAA